MKKIFCLFFALLISLTLSSCKEVLEQNSKKATKKNINETLVFGTNNEYLKQTIQKRKEEEEKRKIEMWRAEHLLASSSTIFDQNQIERTNNIKLASTYINGLILNPGDVFSFNNIVGKRTTERGFLPAEIYVSSNGVVTSTLAPGGGICQVSSTLCMAVMQTQMEIVERNVHSKEVFYATRENEAMINWGTSDFRFKNNYEFPVQLEIIFCNVEQGEQIICNIFSM